MPGKGRTWRQRHRSHHLSSRPTDKPFSLQHEKQFISLKKWMKKNGFKSKNLRLAVFPETGRGLMTRRLLHPGDSIISVPSHLLITTRTALSTYIGKALEKIDRLEVSPLQVLCLFLVYEKFQGGRSFWQPYISSLPDTFTTPAFFTEEERRCLPGFLQRKANTQLESIKASFLSSQVIADHVEEENKDLAGGLTWEEYLWAWGVVNTRSVYMEQDAHPSLTGEDHYALVPLLDMLNHTASAKVKAKFCKSTNSYTIQTYDTYQPYDQVFICYGPHDNARLLLEYGFILPVNPHNAVMFEEGDFNILRDQFSEREWEKKNLMMRDNELLTSLCCSVDGPSWNLQCLFRILVKDWQTRISCGEYLMTEPTEKEKYRMKKMFDTVLKEKIHCIQDCQSMVKECPASDHITMVAALLKQMEEMLVKRNLKRVTFDTG